MSLSYVKGANTLLSLSYAYGTGNNGQIATITDNGDSTKSMTYTYDALGGWPALSIIVTRGVAPPFRPLLAEGGGFLPPARGLQKNT